MEPRTDGSPMGRHPISRAGGRSERYSAGGGSRWEMPSYLIQLECSRCGERYDPRIPQTVCQRCSSALKATYDLSGLRRDHPTPPWSGRPPGLWRYEELLPLQDPSRAVRLGETQSPVVTLNPPDIFPELRLSMKDDGVLPTGSFKARGMAIAVSMARALGLRSLYVPSAGNAGVALAAYGARAKIPVRVYLPEATPLSISRRCEEFGAEVIRVEGTIADAGRFARAREPPDAFDMSTLREPYRWQGKKTMGLELFDQFPPGELPQVLLYPTGGGTGLVGLASAFQELSALGWLSGPLPRLVAVQPEHCAPVVQALRAGAAEVTPWPEPRTVAPGLLVPAPFSSHAILDALRAFDGDGITVSDSEILEAQKVLRREQGISVCPEGAATWAALEKLLGQGKIGPQESVLLYNTGSGLLYGREGG